MKHLLTLSFLFLSIAGIAQPPTKYVVVGSYKATDSNKVVAKTYFDYILTLSSQKASAGDTAIMAVDEYGNLVKSGLSMSGVTLDYILSKGSVTDEPVYFLGNTKSRILNLHIGDTVTFQPNYTEPLTHFSIRRDSLNAQKSALPGTGNVLSYGATIENVMAYDSATLVKTKTATGLQVSANIGSRNTSTYPSSGTVHPQLIGISAKVAIDSGATGYMEQATPMFITYSKSTKAPDFTINHVAMLDITGNSTVPNLTAIRISDIHAGTHAVGIMFSSQDALPPQDENFLMYDASMSGATPYGWPLFFKGQMRLMDSSTSLGKYKLQVQDNAIIKGDSINFPDLPVSSLSDSTLVISSTGFVKNAEPIQPLLDAKASSTINWNTVMSNGNVSTTPAIIGLSSVPANNSVLFNINNGTLYTAKNGVNNVGFYASGAGVAMSFQRSRDTLLNTALQSGDDIANIYFTGTNGSSSTGVFGANITVQAAENWSSSARGTEFIIATVPNGATTAGNRFVIDGNGDVKLNPVVRNVVIGSGTNSSNAKLYVSGTARIADSLFTTGQDNYTSALALGSLSKVYKQFADSNYFMIGGNSNIGDISLGTNSVNSLSLETSNISRLLITADGHIIIPAKTPPASAAATGTTGTVIWGDDGYLYRCTATNTWTRVQLTAW